jgi:FkbM family methyltransferase
MLKVKERIRSLIRLTGYEVAHRRSAPIGYHKFTDIQRKLGAAAAPVIFDVGANTGQTVIALKSLYPGATIHSFEPSPSVFQQLSAAVSNYPDVRLNNFALGSCAGEQKFLENTSTDMSSFLEPDKECWGTIVRTPVVKIASVDDYCTEHGIARIDLLKVDTQGFDLEVLKGASGMMKQGRIALVLVELTFCELYRNAPAVDEIMKFLREYRFNLVAFYDMHYKHDVADWCDGLFVHGA